MLWLKVLPQEQQELFSIMVKKSNEKKPLPKTKDVEEVKPVEAFPGKKVNITIDIPNNQTNPHVLFAICAGQANGLISTEVSNNIKECNK